MDGSSVGDGFIWVDTTTWLFAVEELLDELLDLRDSSTASDEDDLIDVGLFQTGILEYLLDWLQSVSEQVNVELLESGSGQCLGEVLAVEERLDLNSGGELCGEGSLGLLDLTSELLDGAVVFSDVLAALLLEELDEVLHDSIVEVLASQVSVAVRGYDLEYSVVDGEERHVESTAAQVEHENVLLALFLVQTVRDRSGCWLVDDTDNVKT